jgi:hypothetical protein
MKEYNAMDGWVTYIPEFEGNREEANPITVEIKPLTVREARKAAGNITAKRAKGGAFRTNQAEQSLATFRNHVRNIKNLKYNGQSITTPDELLDTPLNQLADEIDAAISDASILDEGDVKNFELQSDGYFVRKKHGTAESAPKNNSERETAAASTTGTDRQS